MKTSYSLLYRLLLLNASLFSASIKTMDYYGDINALRPDGQTELTYAALHNDIQKVDELLHAGANPDVPNKFGQTALFEAVVGENPEIVQAVLDAGADTNMVNSLGYSPLAMVMDVRIAKMLLKAGANPNSMIPGKGPISQRPVVQQALRFLRTEASRRSLPDEIEEIRRQYLQ